MFCLFVSLQDIISEQCYTFVQQLKVMVFKTNNSKPFRKTTINKKNKKTKMKKQILVIALTVSVLLLASATYATEKNATDKSYTVHSIVDGHKTVSAYDKNGKLNYSIQYYTADNLAKNIMDIVSRSFESYYISGMEKVNQPGKNEVWVVHMENAKSMKTVHVSDGETELVNDFAKK